MNKRLALALLVLFLPLAGYCQQEYTWIQVIEHGLDEYLYDIYTLADEGYVVCGKSNEPIHDSATTIIDKVDNDGNLVWSRLYGQPAKHVSARSIIEADNGDLLTCGQVADVAQVLRVDSEGRQIWRNFYNNGYEFYAIIELKSGEFLVCGRSSQNSNYNGYVVKINGDGDVLWDRVYRKPMGSKLYNIRETEGGVVMNGSYNTRNGGASQVWMLKIELENGDPIWENEITHNDYCSCSSMYPTPDGGFTITGVTLFPEFDDHTRVIPLIKVNADGEELSFHTFEERVQDKDQSNSHLYVNNLGIIIAGNHSRYNLGYRLPMIVYTTSDGQELFKHVYTFDEMENFRDGGTFRSIVKGHNDTVVLVGEHFQDQQEYDGIIMEIEPLNCVPRILYWTPEDTLLTVLPHDSIEFAIHLHNPLEYNLDFLWSLEDSVVSTDTLALVTFDELGIFNVSCEITGADIYYEVNWHVTVSEFFIAATSPDSSHLLTRRGSTLPFTIDVACVEPEGPAVEWSVVNRDHNREFLGESDSVNVTFDLAGDWALEAEATWNGERESVRWQIEVRSAVWWWMPHEDAITVNRNDDQDFSVFPFNPNSESLCVEWWLDGDSLDSNTEVLSLDFPDLGEHELMSIVYDGSDADTITWMITVDESGIVNDYNGIPTELTLHSPVPNPFNSTTTIGYSLPVAGRVSLVVYDLSGRELGRLVDGVKSAGMHEAVWVADGVSSGVYIIVLDAGGVMLREKVVLVK